MELVRPNKTKEKACQRREMHTVVLCTRNEGYMVACERKI